MNKTSIFLLVILSTLVCACKPSQESTLIGKWTARDEVRIGRHEFDVSTTFNPDHTFVSETYDRLPPHAFSKTRKGSWKIEGDSLTVSSDTVSQGEPDEIRSDIITLTDHLLVISTQGAETIKPQTTTFVRAQ